MPTLDWIGKEAVRQHHREVPFHLLREVPKLGVKHRSTEAPKHRSTEAPKNTLVRGDNLLALKALLPFYAGQVKCVYIDPPYNTGNEGWVYNDNVNSPAIREWLDKTVGKEAEDLGRHDKWLCMMYPRLALLHEVLAEDGSLWMSIDDNEVHHARAVLDDVFGPQNFVAKVIWQKVFSPKNSAQYLSEDHDYIVVYAKNKGRWRPNLLPRSAEADGRYTNPDGDHRGDWTSGDLSARNYYGDGTYAVTAPSGRVFSGPPPGRYWAVSKQKMEALDADGRVWWGDSGDNVPRLKRFLSEVKDGVVPQTLWFFDDVGHTQEAKKELIEILDFQDSADVFVTPKPTRLIDRVLQIATQPGDLVLDSFAGSGTTGHAVLKQNAEDGGDRRFILVEMEDAVAGPVTAERLQRVIEGYPFSGKDRTELYRQKVTVTSFKKGADHYADAQSIKANRAEDFDAFEQKVEKGDFVLYGVKILKMEKPGLGGGFRFFEIGDAVYDNDGRLNPSVPYGELARYAYYAETRRPLEAPDQAVPPLVGLADGGTAVYLLPSSASGDGAAPSATVGVLDRQALASLPAHDGLRVVWATACRVGADLLDRHRVTFRQIPYDLRTR